MTKNSAKIIIASISQKLRKELKPEKIILFGSYAYGQPTQDSDIDFLVITAKPIARKKIDLFSQESTRSTSIPIQIIPMLTKEFLETKDVIGGIAYPAAKYGRILYEKS